MIAPPIDWIGRLITEAELQRTIVQALKTVGWAEFHDRIAWKSDPGWLDLTTVHPVWQRTAFVELKKETGKPSARQQEWMRVHLAAGNEVYLLKPSSWETFVRALLHPERPKQEEIEAWIAPYLA